MPPIRPIAELDTHLVTNQPPMLVDINLFSADRALQDAIRVFGGAAHHERLTSLGARVGSEEVLGWGETANRHPPRLATHDHQGRRIDEVSFHPAYHHLMALGIEAGFAALPIQEPPVPAGHLAHAAILFLTGHADSGTSCPQTMTYAAVAALDTDPTVGAPWIEQIRAGRYDPTCRPAPEKTGVTIGMAMTEKQGGSDVRANTTSATPCPAMDVGWYRLSGHKWFCSAPMSDAFVTLARTTSGLTCFLLPRWLPDGERNAGFRIVRLKDKLGDRSNASSEIEYHGALAQRLGPEGRGLATILHMVQHTRFDCTVAAAQQMRAAVQQALWYCAHRSAFGRQLIDQPLMATVLADLAVTSEAATFYALHLAHLFDTNDPLARLLTPVGKYWLCKQAPAFAYEAMECLGGAGYVETGPMPRLFRQSPLNAIWEGSGNIIALDVLRALTGDTELAQRLRAFLAAPKGQDRDYDAFVAALDPVPADAAMARLFVENLALAVQAAILFRAESPFAHAFCRLRLRPRGVHYGASNAKIDTKAILARAMPACL